MAERAIESRRTKPNQSIQNKLIRLEIAEIFVGEKTTKLRPNQTIQNKQTV